MPRRLLLTIVLVGGCTAREAIRPEPSPPALLTTEQSPPARPVNSLTGGHSEPAEPAVSLTGEQSAPATAFESGPPIGCPDDDFDPRSCPATLPAGYGRSPDAALEWGRYAIGELGRGRLSCPGGAWPTVVRQGSVNATTPSASPRSPVPKYEESESPDLLDRWLVTCPGQPALTLYGNIYRCGNPCPPPPLGFTPAAAETAYRAAWLLARDRKSDLALELMDRALAVAPESEKFHSYRGVVLMQLDRPEEAVAEFDFALRHDPDSVMHRLNRIGALEAAGDQPGVATAYHLLLGALGEAHADRPKVQCRHATWLFERGRDEEAFAQARAACAAGATKCCDP